MRSHWAWGYEDKFPSDDTRRAMARRFAAAFGQAPDILPLPSLEAAKIPEPRFAPTPELRAMGTTDQHERAIHTYGRGYPDVVRGFYGDFAAAPDWVFYPTSEEKIVLLYRFCEKESIALVPFGGGTSVVGGVECAAHGRFRGVACVDLSRMAKVLEVDETSRAALIQAGATGPEIAKQLDRYGFALRHYPQSFEFSTLGGWIATRAGGHYATVYTHIDDFVESVKMVTPAGVFETRPVPASGAGPSPERFVLGSEGAFGIITEAWIRVQPKPRWRASASVHFDIFERGVEVARLLAQSGLYPVNCRLLDAGEAMLHQVDDQGRVVLLLGFESADHPVQWPMARALAIATDLGGCCIDEPKYTSDGDTAAIEHSAASASAWKQAFFDAPYLGSALVSMGIMCDTFETACTWDRFRAMHEAIVKSVSDVLHKELGGGFVTCRFTHVYPDGPAPYYTFVARAKPGTELEAWAAVKAAASDAIITHGGTTTHHHAVGRVHRATWEKERPPLFEKVLLTAKHELDPIGILNPGCLLAESR